MKNIFTEDNYLGSVISYLEDLQIYLTSDDEHEKSAEVEELIEYLNRTSDEVKECEGCGEELREDQSISGNRHTACI